MVCLRTLEMGDVVLWIVLHCRQVLHERRRAPPARFRHGCEKGGSERDEEVAEAETAGWRWRKRVTSVSAGFRFYRAFSCENPNARFLHMCFTLFFRVFQMLNALY